MSPMPMHCHKCKNCGTIWTHPDASNNIERLHACPKCGVLNWTIYIGPGEPSVVMEGPTLEEVEQRQSKADGESF